MLDFFGCRMSFSGWNLTLPNRENKLTMTNSFSKLPNGSIRKVWSMDLTTILKPSMIGQDHLLNCHPPRPHLLRRPCMHSCWVACKIQKNNSMLQERSSLWLGRKLRKQKMLLLGLNLTSEALVLKSCIPPSPFI